MRRDPGAELARAIAFTEGIAARCAKETESFRWGRGFFDPSIPDIWDRNFLLVDEPDEDTTMEGLVEEAERIMGARGLRHRQIVVQDEMVGDRLASGFAELGWEVTEALWMVHRCPPDRSSEVPVDELVEAAHTLAKDEFNRRNPDVVDEEIVRQMRAAARAVGEATDKRCFGAYVGDVVASVCELYSDGLTAQIEDVGTLEEHRGRGLATAVVLRALHEAQAWGHDLVFLLAETDDWPKELYRKLGFDGIGHTHYFLLKLPEVAKAGE